MPSIGGYSDLGSSTHLLNITAFKGVVASNHGAFVDVRADYERYDNSIALEIANRAPFTAHIGIFDRYNSRRTTLELGPGDSGPRSWSLARERLVQPEGDGRWRFAVRVPCRRARRERRG